MIYFLKFTNLRVKVHHSLIVNNYTMFFLYLVFKKNYKSQTKFFILTTTGHFFFLFWEGYGVLPLEIFVCGTELWHELLQILDPGVMQHVDGTQGTTEFFRQDARVENPGEHCFGIAVKTRLKRKQSIFLKNKII